MEGCSHREMAGVHQGGTGWQWVAGRTWGGQGGRRSAHGVGQ
jgi:hypothetical protein